VTPFNDDPLAPLKEPSSFGNVPRTSDMSWEYSCHRRSTTGWSPSVNGRKRDDDPKAREYASAR